MIFLEDGAELGRLLGLEVPAGLALIDLRAPGAEDAFAELYLARRLGARNVPGIVQLSGIR